MNRKIPDKGSEEDKGRKRINAASLEADFLQLDLFRVMVSDEMSWSDFEEAGRL